MRLLRLRHTGMWMRRHACCCAVATAVARRAGAPRPGQRARARDGGHHARRQHSCHAVVPAVAGRVAREASSAGTTLTAAATIDGSWSPRRPASMALAEQTACAASWRCHARRTRARFQIGSVPARTRAASAAPAAADRPTRCRFCRAAHEAGARRCVCTPRMRQRSRTPACARSPWRRRRHLRRRPRSSATHRTHRSPPNSGPVSGSAPSPTHRHSWRRALRRSSARGSSGCSPGPR